MGPFVSRLYLIVVFYGIPTSHALGKRSSDGNGNESLSAGETASLVVGIIGVLLTGITVFKGLQCWRLRRELSNPAITNIVNYYPPTLSYLPPVNLSSGHEIPLDSFASQAHIQAPIHQPRPPLPLQLSMPSAPDKREPQMHTGRASTWPTTLNATTPLSASVGTEDSFLCCGYQHLRWNMRPHLPVMKRSGDGNTNQGLTEGEIVGLVVGIIGILLTALTVFIGRKSRRNQANSAVTNNYHYPSAPLHPCSEIPISPVQGVPLHPIVSQPPMHEPVLHPRSPMAPPRPLPIHFRPNQRLARTQTGRTFTWPTNADTASHAPVLG